MKSWLRKLLILFVVDGFFMLRKIIVVGFFEFVVFCVIGGIGVVKEWVCGSMSCDVEFVLRVLGSFLREFLSVMIIVMV